MPFPRAVSRHRVTLAATALLAATAFVTADGAVAVAATPPAHVAAAAANTVQTLYGKVTVPAAPKRIVAFDFPEATALADLGIKPIGIGNYTPALPYYTKFLKGVSIITDSSGNPDLEKIAALKPDLIIGDEFSYDIAKNRNLYTQLSAIAPTVMLKWTEAAGNWPADAAGTAAAVGKTAQMNKLRSTFLTHAAQIKKTYASVLSTHTIDLISGGSGTAAGDWFLYGPNSSHGKVLATAGARFGAAKGQKPGFLQYSTEKYGLLQNSDVVIIDAADGTSAKPITSNPVFAALPAAKDGDVFTTPYFFTSSYRIANALLGDFATALKTVQSR